MLIGFGAGLVSSSSYLFLYYWLLAPAGPAAIAAVLALVSLVCRRHRRRIMQLAQGALVALLFDLVFMIAAAIVLAS